MATWFDLAGGETPSPAVMPGRCAGLLGHSEPSELEHTSRHDWYNRDKVIRSQIYCAHPDGPDWGYGVVKALQIWRYKRYEARVSSTDDFAQFEQFASGPWTPDMTSKMPWDILIRGPQLGGIDAQTRRVIDLEMERRFRSRQPVIANMIAFSALVIAVIALFK